MNVLHMCDFNKCKETQNQVDNLELGRIRRETKRLINPSMRNTEVKRIPRNFCQYIKRKKNLICGTDPLAKSVEITQTTKTKSLKSHITFVYLYLLMRFVSQLSYQGSEELQKIQII